MEFKDKQAIYLQIADYIYDQILLGKLPPRGRVPSVRDLASSLKVNPNTIMRTYDFLQIREIISSKRGIGYSVNEDAITKILTYKRESFLEAELPEVFRTLYLLNIGLDELEIRYSKFINETFLSTK